VLTLFALMTGGYTEEALAWRDWLLRAAAGDPAKLQIMYGIGGERRLDEYEVPWLPGYEGSAPVRVGNAASEQFQLDVYGETLASLSLMRGIAELPTRRGSSRSRCSTTSRARGSTPTMACGRCGGSASTSPTRR
jgi:GH15 family glucan-1,4-alpha-glucosidase